MKRTKRFFLLALLAVLATAATASALEAGGIVPAQVNPEFVRYLEELRSGTAEGRIAPTAYLSRQSARTSKSAAARAATLPVSFDLVSKGWVTGIKNQRSWGTCWDFATMEALESNLKKETGVEVELSELHLGFFAYYDESDEKPAFDAKEVPGKNKIFDNGSRGTDEPRAILARGTGPVLDADAPYPTVDATDREFWVNYPDDPEAKRDELLAAPNAFRLKESLSFHTSDDIKRALTEYGGLWIAFNANSAVDRQNPYLYTSADQTLNHAVLLVGWDDGLSRDLFSGPNAGYKSPDIDGGWKIQNSWGVSRDINGQEILIGDGGYFWISYADVSIFGSPGANTFVAMPADTYRHTYSHDPLGAVYALETNFAAVETANVFKAERNEDLVYVGFMANGFDVDYAIQVYRNIPEAGEPDEGTPVFQTPQTGTADFPGYRTVKLDTPVPLDKDERFAVVVTLTSSTDDIEIPAEATIDTISSKAAAGAGESYVRALGDTEWEEVLTFSDSFTSGGKLYEVAFTNLTIKAFTNDANRGSSGSSGCATGAFALILVAAVPLVLRGRRG